MRPENISSSSKTTVYIFYINLFLRNLLEIICSLLTAEAEQPLQWQGNGIYKFDGVAVGWFMFSKSCLNSPDRSLKVKNCNKKS